MDRERLRATFDEDAERYDRARPTYPPELIGDLCALADVGPRSRILEIGAGTGQMTVPLAERGAEIVAVELGTGMAGVARRNLDRFSSVRVVVAAFEDWPLPALPFDAVVSATAWHWIDPAVRTSKAAAALRPGGALALVSTHHVMGGDEAFFGEVQECYERWDPTTPPGLRLPTAEQIPPIDGDLSASGRFTPPVLRSYQRDITYSTHEYLDVLLTYSGHRDLETGRRKALLDCIADLLDSRYGGRITKRYLHQLAVARRRPV